MRLLLREAKIPKSRHVLILVENLPVPFDRRVWQEAKVLSKAGHTVSVICPMGRGHDAPYEVLDGVHIYRHPLAEARSPSGYPLEYFSALSHQLRLSFRVQQRQPIDVIQACNPPDLLFLIALVHRALFKTRFIFDHHDLSPELYVSKFGREDLLFKLLGFLERQTFRMADASIATNETFREIALERGKMAPDQVFIVKSYPELAQLESEPAEIALPKGCKHLVGYVGIMGSQDGVDTLIRAVHEIVHVRKRTDIGCILVGDGPEYPNLQALARELNLEEAVRFTGYLTGAALLEHLAAFHIGVIPDPPNSFNDKLSMNKVFEYMMLGIPFVQFDLRQAKREAAGAGFVVKDHSPQALAEGILTLADDAERRGRMAEAARSIATKEFKWTNEATRYLAAYESVFTKMATQS